VCVSENPLPPAVPTVDISDNALLLMILISLSYRAREEIQVDRFGLCSGEHDPTPRASIEVWHTVRYGDFFLNCLFPEKVNAKERTVKNWEESLQDRMFIYSLLLNEGENEPGDEQHKHPYGIEVRCGKITDASVSGRDVICVSNEVLGKTMEMEWVDGLFFSLSIVISLLP